MQRRKRLSCRIPPFGTANCYCSLGPGCFRPGRRLNLRVYEPVAASAAPGCRAARPASAVIVLQDSAAWIKSLSTNALDK